MKLPASVDTLTLTVLVAHHPRTAMIPVVLSMDYKASHCAECASRLTTSGWMRAQVGVDPYCRWCSCRMDDSAWTP